MQSLYVTEDKQIRKAAYHTLVDAGAAEKPYRGVRKSHGDDGRPDGFPKEPLAFCPKRTAEELAAAPPEDEDFNVFKAAFLELSKGEEWLQVDQLQTLIAKLGFALSSKGARDFVQKTSPYGVNSDRLHWSEVAWAYAQVLRGDGDLDGPAPLHGLCLLHEEVQEFLEQRGVPQDRIDALIQSKSMHGEIRPDVLLELYAPPDAFGPSSSERDKLRAEIASVNAQKRAEERAHEQVIAQCRAQREELLTKLEEKRQKVKAAEKQRAAEEEAAFFKQAAVKNEELCHAARAHAFQKHQQRQLEEQKALHEMLRSNLVEK